MSKTDIFLIIRSAVATIQISVVDCVEIALIAGTNIFLQHGETRRYLQAVISL